MAKSVDDILKEHREQAAPEPVPAPPEDEDNKFYSTLGGDLVADPFLELRFKKGFRLCLPYRDLVWFSYDPDGPTGPVIEMDFAGTAVHVTGRGLGGELFESLKQRRVVWMREAVRELEDNDANAVFIKEIDFGPADAGEKQADGEATGS